jgi:hypothetical protein
MRPRGKRPAFGAYEHIPGVPAAGHIASNGYWHPGRIKGCHKCEPPEPRLRDGVYDVTTATFSAGFALRDGEVVWIAPILRRQFDRWRLRAKWIGPLPASLKGARRVL